MSQYRRILDARTLTADLVQSRDEVWDAGAWRELELQFRVLKAGSAGTAKLQHAAVNEEDAYEDLATASISLTGSSAVVSISHFLRFVRWITDGSVAGDPVVVIDAVAKGQ